MMRPATASRDGHPGAPSGLRNRRAAPSGRTPGNAPPPRRAVERPLLEEMAAGQPQRAGVEGSASAWPRHHRRLHTRAPTSGYLWGSETSIRLEVQELARSSRDGFAEIVGHHRSCGQTGSP